MASFAESTAVTAPASQGAGAVLLFDGECGLCQRVVRVLLRLDRRGVVRYAPLQGPAAQAYLRAQGLPTEDFDSLVWVADWTRRGPAVGAGAGPGFLLRTDGAIAALRAVGGLGRVLAAVLAVVPPSWRDAGYCGIARCRYRIFGEWRPRPLARAEWAARFLS